MNDIGPHGHRDWAAGERDLCIELEYPRVQPGKNILLAFDSALPVGYTPVGYTPVGYAIVEPEANIGRSVVGVGTTASATESIEQLLEWAIVRAGEIAPIVHLATRSTERSLSEFVQGRGWEQVREYYKLEKVGDLVPADASLPSGFTVRTMLGLDELSELTHIQNESFKSHFGYSPNTESEIKSSLFAPGSSIDNIVMIHDSSEQLVAYCWTEISHRAGLVVGRIGMTGVLPAAQEQGLGRAIAESGYNHLLKRNVDLVELDVDSANAAAMKIYTSLGFDINTRLWWWEKQL